MSYAATISTNGAGELADWAPVSGETWVNTASWSVSGDVWLPPRFNDAQWGFRRYTGSAFGSDGQMPPLYQFTVKVRPKSDTGQITLVPFYVDPTHYEAVILNLTDKNVSIVEYSGGTPTSGATGTLDLSQKHRGWRPLPAPNDDGSHTVKMKVNTKWHSLAVWVGDTWIDTPLVPAITEPAHGVAIRSNGTPHEILGVDIKRFTDPYLAR